ncbi:MAG: hypothetical protein Q9160_000308 [Pyrenula sp. 1 TL-2023]
MDVATRLRRAIASNDLSLTRRILSNNPSYLQNPDLNTNGNTSLHLAAFYGHTAIAEFLISLGHDTTSPSSPSSPSNGSKSTGSPAEGSSLSHHNANLLTLNPSSLGISHNIHNSTPLHLAAANGHTQAIHLLCHHFPQTLNRQDNDGATPLMLASRGHPALTTTAGPHSSFPPSINPFSSSTTTPLSAATVSSNNTPTTATDSSDPSAILTLLSPPHPSTTSASVHIRDMHGNTCLHYASAWGNLKALRLLIQAGADPLATNNAHWTPQYYSLTVQAEVYYKGLVAEWERLRRGPPGPITPAVGDGRTGARKMGEERRGVGVGQGQAAIKGGGMVRLVTREDDEDEGSEDSEEMAVRGRSGSRNTLGRGRGQSDGMGELGVSLGRVDTWK